MASSQEVFVKQDLKEEGGGGAKEDKTSAGRTPNNGRRSGKPRSHSIPQNRRSAFRHSFSSVFMWVLAAGKNARRQDFCGYCSYGPVKVFFV
jgi:hypothetical protein